MAVMVMLSVPAVRSVEYTSASANKGIMVPEPLDIAIVSYRIQVQRNWIYGDNLVSGVGGRRFACAI